MGAESDMALESELLAEESYSYSMSYSMSAATDAAATPELKVNAPAMEIA